MNEASSLKSLDSEEISLEKVKNTTDFEGLLKLRVNYYAHKNVRKSFDNQAEQFESLDELTKGKAAWIQGNYESAAQALSSQTEGLYLYLAGESYFNLENWQQALTTLEKASQNNAPEPLTTRLIIESLANLNELDKAQETYKKLDPSQAAYSYCEGLLNDKQGNHEKAIELYEKCLEIDPTDSYALFHLAAIYDRYGNDEKAIELLEQCCEQIPVLLAAVVNLGILYEDAERYQDAAYCYEEILEVMPNATRAKLFFDDVRQSFNMTYDEEAERLRDQQLKLLQTKIADFELSVRSHNCLQKMDIHTLGDLVSKTEQELLSYPNFGETSLQEIKDILKAKKIRLGQSLTPGSLLPTLASPIQQEAQDPVLNTPISTLKLSVRSNKVLESLGVTKLGDLVEFTEEQMMAQKNFGKTSIKEIKDKLNEYGLHLTPNEKKGMDQSILSGGFENTSFENNTFE